ncbi:Stage II sporulation protein E (SpoIIE) [Thiorhodovibrio winogradskyi]|uniref:Stage II sporulation protein E (SpoIIE) n=1 Tax=Thiorhodovibrio winogradskyi TaxID=77007 RepID=A0ABZ0S6Q9_9GAMM|nr:SpoIIE family protein phosphatase [Thiorhodovibrio winogradskyi]
MALITRSQSEADRAHLDAAVDAGVSVNAGAGTELGTGAQTRTLGTNLSSALRPLPGESACGDQLDAWLIDTGLRLAVADGLGHGPEAQRAAVTALDELRQASPGLELAELFARCDQALIGTRGVALAVVDVRPDAGQVLHASVGNVRTLLIHQDKVRRLGGARGIVGAGFRALRPERFVLAPGDWLVLYSDGIAENADLATALAEADLEPDPNHVPENSLASRLLARWASDRDDASLLLYRHV